MMHMNVTRLTEHATKGAVLGPLGRGKGDQHKAGSSPTRSMATMWLSKCAQHSVRHCNGDGSPQALGNPSISDPVD